MKLRRALGLSAVLASWGVLVFACSVDDSNPVVARRQISDDTQGDGDGGKLADGAYVDGALGAPICGIYGGTAGALTFALGAIEATKTDCRISATLVETTTDNHSIQCFQSFVAAAEQCSGYSIAKGTTDNDGVTCTRPIGDTLSDDDFDAFEQDLSAYLSSKGMTATDIAVIVDALNAQKVEVVNDDIPLGKFTLCAANCRDAGAACIPAPVDAGTKDSGTTVKDSGTTPVKDASAPVDSGSASKDSGTTAPPVDSGTSPPKDASTD